MCCVWVCVCKLHVKQSGKVILLHWCPFIIETTHACGCVCVYVEYCFLLRIQHRLYLPSYFITFVAGKNVYFTSTWTKLNCLHYIMHILHLLTLTYAHILLILTNTTAFSFWFRPTWRRSGKDTTLVECVKAKKESVHK